MIKSDNKKIDKYLIDLDILLIDCKEILTGDQWFFLKKRASKFLKENLGEKAEEDFLKKFRVHLPVSKQNSDYFAKRSEIAFSFLSQLIKVENISVYEKESKVVKFIKNNDLSPIVSDLTLKMLPVLLKAME